MEDEKIVSAENKKWNLFNLVFREDPEIVEACGAPQGVLGTVVSSSFFRLLVRLYIMPDVTDEESVRAWLKNLLDLLSRLAQRTETTIDDDIIKLAIVQLEENVYFDYALKVAVWIAQRVEKDDQNDETI